MVKFAKPLVAALVIIGGLTFSVADAFARQTRPALTRDVDNPALQPVRLVIQIVLNPSDLMKTQDSITVPAGKRLVIENASIWGITNGGDRFTGIWLAPTNLATFHLLDPNSTEFRPLDANTELVAYNRVMKGYFNAGETLQGWAFTSGTAGGKILNLYLQGHYVNVP